jgi:hypothetical protein
MTVKKGGDEMAKRVDSFFGPDEVRYPWDDWSDGSIWEIKLNQDYLISTETMRVYLHQRAKAENKEVETHKVSGDDWEGLRFKFQERQPGPRARGPKPLTAGIRTMQF